MKGLLERNIELPSHYIPQVASVHWTSYSTTRKILMILSMRFTHSSNPLLTFSKTATSLYSMIIVKLSHRLRHLLCPCKVFQSLFLAHPLPLEKGNPVPLGDICCSHRKMWRWNQASPCQLLLQGHRAIFTILPNWALLLHTLDYPG